MSAESGTEKHQPQDQFQFTDTPLERIVASIEFGIIFPTRWARCYRLPWLTGGETQFRVSIEVELPECRPHAHSLILPAKFTACLEGMRNGSRVRSGMG